MDRKKAPVPSLYSQATHLSSFSQYEMKPCRRTGVKIPTLVRKEFPKELMTTLQMTPGNNICADCYVREKLGEDTISEEERDLFFSNRDSCQDLSMWANAQFGTLICSKCAEDQINMHKEVSINNLLFMY